MSLNDPQWGRKPDAENGAAPSPTKPPATPSPTPNTPPAAPPPSPPPAPTPSSDNGGGSGNNGNKGNNGPDFDELLKKVNEKVSEIFGGGNKKPPNNQQRPGNGGGPKLPDITPQMAARGLTIAALIGLGIWFASGFYIVDEGKRGIVQRFGKYAETTEAGPHWHWPWPIESRQIIKFNDVRSVDIGFKGSAKNRDQKQAQMLTEDLNIIDITFSVQYTLADARAYMFNHRDPDGAVVQAAETAMREVVGKRKMDFLLNQGREEFAGATQKLMQQLLDRYGTGIVISKLNLQAVAAPEAVNEAFQDVVKAQQDRDRQVNEGQAYANGVIPKARGSAARLMEEASGYEQSVLARAEGDAARFTSVVGEYTKAPAVTRDRLYIDMMQSVLGNSSKVFVDQKAGQSLLYLPLDKLMAQTKDAAAKEAAREALPAESVNAKAADVITAPSSANSANTVAPNGRESTRGSRDTRSDVRN